MALPVIPNRYPRANKAARSNRETVVALCRNRVPRAGRDEDGIARADHSTFAVEFYLARAFEDEIKFLRELVIVSLCPASRRDLRFGKALVLDRRIRAIDNRTDS